VAAGVEERAGDAARAGTDVPSREAEVVERLGRRAKAWRTGLVLVLGVLFCAGSLIGDDPWWPFGPWRMFSTSQAPTGAVWSTEMEVRTAAHPAWGAAPITPESVGLNRAEIEGRLDEISRDPAMLGTLALSHERLRPDAPRWTGVRIVQRRLEILDRVPTGREQVRVLATWGAP
jgi:hypothetical protein